MNSLIPPIGAGTPVTGVETDRERKPVRGGNTQADTISTLLTDTRKTSDKVSIRISSQSDAESLKDSLSLVMEKVTQQVTRVFPDDPKQREKLGLPKNIDEYSMDDLKDYFSPEKTANRIVDFTTGFFGTHQLNHQDEKGGQQVDGFTALVKKAIKEGFDQAIGILGDLDSLGQIGENVKKTYVLVMRGLDDFRQEKLDLLGNVKNAPVTTKPFIEEAVKESFQTTDSKASNESSVASGEEDNPVDLTA